MNFFEHQDKARKETGLLIFYFSLAVILIVAIVNLVVRLVATLATSDLYSPSGFHSPIGSGEHFLISIGTIALIAGGSLFKIQSLSKGGGTGIAESLGGVKVSFNTSDPKERQLLNVVEEMAIASGCRVPRVYLLKNERGLNAFSAGFTINTAVIAVTQGSLHHFNRDELQGAIGHEFSHILNGDMQLNLRLIGVLHGIMLISLIGKSMMSESLSRFRNWGNMLGLPLYMVGYIGLFFGKLIKASISRQREFLADASSVQFTRNPSGIANALKKIGGLTYGSTIYSVEAEETSHLFFGNAITESFMDFEFMATHPPIQERIKRIDRAFDRKLPNLLTGHSTLPSKRVVAVPKPSPFTIKTEQFMNQVGSLSCENLQYSFQTLSTLPMLLSNAVHEPLEALAVVYGLLLNPDPNMQVKQKEYLQENAAKVVVANFQRLLPLLEALPTGNRGPLLELSLTSLRNLSHAQYADFEIHMNALIHLDGHVSRFELVVQKLFHHNLAPHFENRPKRTPQFVAFAGIKHQIELLLSTLSHWGNPKDEKTAFAAFQKGVSALRRHGETFKMRISAECTSDALDNALNILESTPPFVRQRILESCANCILSNQKVTLEESETLRMVAACLDCPVPPILDMK